MIAVWLADTCQPGSATPKTHALPYTFDPITSSRAWYQVFVANALAVDAICVQLPALSTHRVSVLLLGLRAITIHLSEPRTRAIRRPPCWNEGSWTTFAMSMSAVTSS